MTRAFREDFNTEAGFISRWEDITNVETYRGTLRLENIEAESSGWALRRVQMSSQIETAYTAVSVFEVDNAFFDVYLSRNARHYTLATETEEGGVFTVATDDWKETDGTADYVDTGQAADTGKTTLGIYLFFEAIAETESDLSSLRLKPLETVLVTIGVISADLSTLTMSPLDGDLTQITSVPRVTEVSETRITEDGEVRYTE